MDYQKLFSKAKENNINDIQVIDEYVKLFHVKTTNDNVEIYEIHSNNKYNIKAIIDNKTVYINLEKNDFDLDKIIECIKNNSKYLDSSEKDYIISDTSNNCLLSRDDDIVFNTNITDKLLSYNTLREEYDNFIEISNEYYEIYTRIKIVNNNDVVMEDDNKYCMVVTNAIFKENDKISSTFDEIYINDVNELDLDKFVTDNVKNTNDKLNFKKIKNGKYNVLLKNECLSNIFQNINSIFFGDNIQNNKSPLVNKIGEKVFGNNITIIENPNDENYFGKRLFDNEGTLTSYKEIVSDGVFKSPIYDIKSGEKENIKSTGNKYNGIGFKNFYLKPENNSFEDLLNKLDNGILIDKVHGMHATINPYNGNISLQCEGYIIENGKMIDSSKLFIISTDIFELLNNITEIGNDIKYTSLNFASPSVIIKNMSLSS
ncbi:MAG: TldD/PmbA family protein [Bacilli bacterium]|nr:TldD/PmbA family protein [Bacilli bacterium]